MEKSAHQQTLLIVDDEPANVVILSELLAGDYQTRAATNGEKALKLAMSDKPPDLILLDIMMPEMDGYETCRRLKADERASKIPVIFITGKVTEQDEIKGFEVGAVDYITKPFNKIIVKARVKTHVDLKLHKDFLEWMLKEKTQEMSKIENEYMALFNSLFKPRT